MKNKFFLLLMAFGLISCSSCQLWRGSPQHQLNELITDNPELVKNDTTFTCIKAPVPASQADTQITFPGLSSFLLYRKLDTLRLDSGSAKNGRAVIHYKIVHDTLKLSAECLKDTIRITTPVYITTVGKSVYAKEDDEAPWHKAGRYFLYACSYLIFLCIGITLGSFLRSIHQI